MNTVRIIPEQVESSSEGAFNDFIDLASVVDFIKRSWLSIAVTTTLGVLAAILFLATSQELYWARTEILIEPKIHQFQQPVSDVNLSLDTSQLESQIAMLRSERITRMVVDDLNLTENQAFLDSADTSITARVKKFLYGLSYPSQPVGEAANGDAGSEQSDTQDGAPAAFDYERYRSTIDLLQQRLSIRRQGVSYAIEIGFSAHDPILAANVANTVAESYLREQIENKSKGAKEGSLWLEKRLQELRTQMNLATQAAQTFRAKHDYSIGFNPDSIDDIPAEDLSRVLQDRLKGPTLEELEVTADTYKKIYESVLQAYMSSVSQQSYPSADARVISPASPALLPSYPRTKLVLALGMFGGILLGVAFTFVRQLLDDRVRTPQQLWNEVGINCVGDLPRPPRQWPGKPRFNVVSRFPRSAYVSALMSLGTTLRLLEGNKPLRFIGVTSADPDTQKGEFVCNLAAMYQRKGINTLVVNADPANSALTTGLQTSFAPGPAEADASTRPSHNDIKAVAGQSYDYLPAGTPLHTSLMKHEVDKSALERLKYYKMIIVELPATGPGMDTLPMESLLDGVVIVAEYGKTRVGALADLLNSLAAIRVAVLGAVLTDVHARSRVNYNRLPVSFTQ